MKTTEKLEGGTSFHDTTIDCSVMKLIEILGAPKYVTNDGSDKTNYEWVMETDNGEVFTVYDWKYYRPLFMNEVVEWHIGGKSKAITERAKTEIMDKINGIKIKNRVNASDFLKWYFSDSDDIYSIGKRVVDELISHGACILTSKKMFEECSYIPQFICENSDGSNEYLPSEIEFIYK